LGLEAQTTAKKVRLNPIYDMRGSAGSTVDVFGQFESQIQQRSDFFLSSLAAEPTDQPDMSDQKSGTPLVFPFYFYFNVQGQRIPTWYMNSQKSIILYHLNQFGTLCDL
jgi:hypothetical protein